MRFNAPYSLSILCESGILAAADSFVRRRSFFTLFKCKTICFTLFFTLNGVMRPVAVDICRKNPYNIVACATILRRGGKTENRGGVLPRRREKVWQNL